MGRLLRRIDDLTQLLEIPLEAMEVEGVGFEIGDIARAKRVKVRVIGFVLECLGNPSQSMEALAAGRQVAEPVELVVELAVLLLEVKDLTYELGLAVDTFLKASTKSIGLGLVEGLLVAVHLSARMGSLYTPTDSKTRQTKVDPPVSDVTGGSTTPD